MRTYIAYKKANGKREYLTEDETFSLDQEKAKKFDVTFWIEILKILIQLLSLFGVSVRLQRVK